MNGSAPWFAAALTVLTLTSGLGTVLAPDSRTAFTAAAVLTVGISAALFVRGRSRDGFGDWRFCAPAVLGVMVLSAQTPVGLVIVTVLLLFALVSYRLMVRRPDLGAVADASSATALLTTAACLAALGLIGGPRGLPVLLPVAAIWLLAWMPLRMRQIREPFAFHVACPPEKLSAYLVDQRNLVAWFPGYTRCELLDGHDPGQGAVFRQVIELRGRTQVASVVVDEYEAGHRLCTHLIGVPGRGGSCYAFTAAVDGTDAVYEYSGEQSYATSLTGTMLMLRGTLGKLRVQRQEAFGKLRSILEAG